MSSTAHCATQLMHSREFKGTREFRFRLTCLLLTSTWMLFLPAHCHLCPRCHQGACCYTCQPTRLQLAAAEKYYHGDSDACFRCCVQVLCAVDGLKCDVAFQLAADSVWPAHTLTLVPCKICQILQLTVQQAFQLLSWGTLLRAFCGAWRPDPLIYF